MITRAQIIAEALRWDRTPAVWGQSARGRGTDCKGFIWGIARELGLPEALVVEAATRCYRKVDPHRLLEGLEAAMVRVEGPPRPADVLAMPLRREVMPTHLGILISEREIMHCRPGSNCVVKVPLGRSRPIHSWWTWPSLGGA